MRDLARAAMKAGQPIDRIRVDPVTVDTTGGNRLGLAFSHTDAELAARAARYFEAWRDKRMLHLYDRRQLHPRNPARQLPADDLHAPGAYAVPYVYYPSENQV